MGTHWFFLRLNLLSFILGNLICIVFLFRSPYISLVLMIKLVGYFGIYLINRQMNRRYDYYFMNTGFTPGRLFLGISLLDFILFSILIAPLKLLF